MIIYPAIDISNGECVRLIKGDFKKKTVFNISPLLQAKIFEKLGFKRVHIVDLDSAKLGGSKNQIVIQSILVHTKLEIQLGGGIRKISQVKKWLSLGVKSLVIGTAAINNFTFLKKISHKYRNKISISLDFKKNFVAKNGWVNLSKFTVKDYLHKIKDLPLKNVILTDIDRDGTKKGLNLKKYKNLLLNFKKKIIISGGVSDINDVKRTYKFKKCKGLIIGRALYDGSINVEKLKSFTK